MQLKKVNNLLVSSHVVLLHNFNLFKILEIESEATKRHQVPILGLLQTTATDHSGRIVIYGDSNCLDMSNLDKACYWMLDAILEYTSSMHLPAVFKNNRAKDLGGSVKTVAPQRMEGNRLYRYSKVLEGHLGESHPRMLPQCPHLAFALPVALNVSAPTNLVQSQKLLAVSEDVVPIVSADNAIKGKRSM